MRQLIQSQTHDKEVENIIITGAEVLIQQSIEQGEKRGEIQAKREFFLKLLDLRIGAVPDTVIHRISRIRSRSRLDILLNRSQPHKLDDIEW